MAHWRYTAPIVALVILGGGLLFKEDGSEILHWLRMFGHHATSVVGNSISEEADVMIGQFVCSGKDAAQIKRLTPIDTLGQLQSDTEALDAEEHELDDLKTQIVVAPTTYLPGPSDLDYRKQLVDRYNTLLASYRNDAAALKQRTDTFNSQTMAHNSYVQQHCQRIGQ